MRHISLPLLNSLITRSRLESTFLRVNLYFEVKLGLATGGAGLGREFYVCFTKNVRSVEFGSGGVQVEGLQYVGCLVIRGWFLK